MPILILKSMLSASSIVMILAVWIYFFGPEVGDL